MTKSKNSSTPNNSKKQAQEKPGKLDTPKSESKQAVLINLMQRPDGATIEEITNATGWQQHSVRGMISGVLKKRLGLSIASDKEERGRIYRIAGSASRL